MLKNIFRAACVAAVGLLSSGEQARAFDGNLPNFSRNTTLGTCTMNHQWYYDSNSRQGRAFLSLDSAYPGGTRIAGTIFVGSGRRSSYDPEPPLTQTIIENCGFSNLDQVNIVGPDTSITYTTFYPTPAEGEDIWAIQNYIGFSFIGTDDSTGVRSRYEFAYSGTTNTILIDSIIPVNAPPPEPVITPEAMTAHRTTPFDITVEFSRDVTGFDPISDAGDFQITNANVTAVSGGQATYTITVEPTGNGDMVMSVPANIAQDFAGAQNSTSNQVTVTYDPDVVLTEITGMPNAVNNTPFNINVRFDTPVTGFDPVGASGDLNVSNADVTAVTGGPSDYTVTLTPTGAGSISVTVPAGIAQNSSGHLNAASATATAAFDANIPSAEIINTPPALDGTNPFDITVRFSVPVVFFNGSSLAVVNGSVTTAPPSSFTPETEFTITITPDGNGDVTITVPAFAARNATTFTPSIASAPVTVSSDAIAPTVVLSTSTTSVVANTPFTVTAAFSEDVTAFDDLSSDVSTSNATVTGITGGPDSYIIEITPDGSGPVTISVPADAAEDLAGNASEASNTLDIELADVTAPSPTISNLPAEYTDTTPFTFTVEFDEDVTGFDDFANDLAVGGGTVTGLTQNAANSYTVEITPDGSGDITLSVPADAAADSAGNTSLASVTETVTQADTVAPTVTLLGLPAEYINTTPFTFTVEFNEDVTGFDDLANDLTVANGTVSAITGGPAIYTVEITPGGDGDITINVPAGTARDAALNDNTASSDATVTKADTTAPSVQITGAPDSFTHTTPFTINVVFSEDVTGFDDPAEDLDVVNGAATAISGGPSGYVVEITPAGTGSVSITVPAAAAQDLAGNDNTESDTVTVGSTRVADTQKAISEFISSRANLLASNQVGLTHFLRDQNCGNFTASANEGGTSVSGCVSGGNAWAAISGAWSDDASYTLATVGAHSRVSDTLLIGGMLQFDSAKQDANNASGDGWLAGPYFVAKAAGQPLWFEGRLLYGQTDNEISVYGGAADHFETERWLAQLQVSGEIMVEETKLIPLLDLTYTDDTQLAYINAVGDLIPEQKVQLTQLTAGMEFSTPIEVASGAFTLNGGLKGIYSSLSNATADYEGMRARVSAGGTYELPSGGVFTGSAFYDGIGTEYESYGASLKFSLSF